MKSLVECLNESTAAQRDEISRSLAKDFIRFMEKEYKVKFELRTRTNWKGEEVPFQYAELDQNVKPAEWEKRKDEFVKVLNQYGPKSKPKCSAYTGRKYKNEVMYVWKDPGNVETAAYVGYDPDQKVIFLHAVM